METNMKQTGLDVKVERENNSTLSIKWGSVEESVHVYWSASPEAIEENGQLLTIVTDASAVTIEDPNPAMRVYFRLVTNKGDRITVAERRLSLQGAFNFRDLGGYETKDGRVVKWGKLYRSEELARLTEEDICYIHNLGLKTICDYRTNFEVQHKPNPKIQDVCQVSLPVMQDLAKDLNINEFFRLGDLSMLGKPGEYLVKMNRDFVTSNGAFVTFLELIQDANNLPLLNHCTAGKDRTGFASALLLLLLGVPEETVMQDYLLSNGFREQLNEKMMAFLGAQLQDEASIEILSAMFEARAEYLQAAFDEIHNVYGSLDQYAEKGIGLTKEQLDALRNLLLEEK